MERELTRGSERELVPFLVFGDDGRLQKIERFSHYVARHLGIKDAERYPNFCKLADDYLRDPKGSPEEIYDFFENQNDPTALHELFTNELESCILSYLAFHWSHASSFINEALSVGKLKKSKLKSMVMSATRKQRIDKVTKNLKVTRVFSTLVDEINAIRTKRDLPRAVETVTAKTKDPRPVLLFMGGGMGAGKSTVLKKIMRKGYWAEAAKEAVVVEADAFKETDVLFRALSARGHDDIIHTAELVHQSSTDAASSLLVTALNEGRDVIMDGTLSWEPFVRQTIEMVRNVHRKRYRMGVGYKVADDGSVTESYWEEAEEDDVPSEKGVKERHPYKIELVGVVCDAHLAVVRGIRRAIIMGRAVRVSSQLRSHKMFATGFPKYCKLVDEAMLFSTNAVGGPAKLIGKKEEGATIQPVDSDYDWLNKVSMLNMNAKSVEDLYSNANHCSKASEVWKDVIDFPSRKENQLQLLNAITKAEFT
ncbi:calmodulin calcium-dependent NAD kinase-like [Nymphaea colorata]|nr:calmodulin calcium-dependent NAD kinase-like [Nymphaea colorata]